MTQHIQKQHYVLAGFLSALLIASAAFFFFFENKKPSAVLRHSTVVTPENPFDSLNLEADAAIVWDIPKNEPLFEKNSEAQLPLASLTKIMTALLAEETLAPHAVVTVPLEAIRQTGDNGLYAGERWARDALTDLTLVTSSNDGAYALASAVSLWKGSSESMFSQLMDNKARELGLRQTFFINESGLDVNAGISGAYGSARDLARLLEYTVLHHPHLFEATQKKLQTFVSLDKKVHNVENTDDIAEVLPGLIASKTGFTDLAGGNLAVVFEAGPGYPLAAVVLASSEKGRFEDTEKLVQASFEYLRIFR